MPSSKMDVILDAREVAPGITVQVRLTNASRFQVGAWIVRFGAWLGGFRYELIVERHGTSATGLEGIDQR